MSIQKRLRGFILGAILMFSAYLAYADTVTVSTYYPSPYGSYQNLDSTADTHLATTSGGLMVGSSGNVTSPSKLEVSGGPMTLNGTSYYLVDRGAGNLFRFCGPSAVCSTAASLVAGKLQLSSDGGFGTAQGTDPGMGGINAPGVVTAGRSIVAQNSYAQLGNAYLSSGSGGNYAHLATNEWFNGVAWVQTAVGALIQIAGQNINFYRHDASGGGHQVSMTIDSAGAIAMSSSLTVGTTVTASSDARFKTDIKPLTGVLSRLDELNAITYEPSQLAVSRGTPTGLKQIGIVGQEIEKVFPELVLKNGPEGYRSVDYSRLSVVLLEALKELEAENQGLKKEQEQLRSDVTELKKRVRETKLGD